MTHKKDFKGVARSIMNPNIKSLDDFLGPDKPLSESKDNTSPDSNTTLIDTFDLNLSDKNKESSVKLENNLQEKRSKPRINEIPTKRISRESLELPKRVRVSLNISIETVHALDQLKTDIRRLIPMNEISSVSKSSIIDAAVAILFEDFRKKELKSEFVKKIFENKKA